VLQRAHIRCFDLEQHVEPTITVVYVALNESHQIILVAAELDDATERIIQ
jgi:hypothetical protein